MTKTYLTVEVQYETILTLSFGNPFAVPLQVTQQGRLLDVEGKGLTGERTHISVLLDEPDDGYAQWEDTLSVDVDNGVLLRHIGNR